MGIVNIFTREAPTLAGYSFDAVLEDTLELAVEVTTYPIESGVRVADHRILLPFKWTMTGAVSNNPLRTHLSDLVGGAISNIDGNPLISGIAGITASFLAGSSETRASATLAFLIELTRYGEPFDINAGDIMLKNMVITKLSRTKEPRNENGLEFIVELQEMITLDRLSALLQPAQDELRTGDPAKSSAARTIEKGQQTTALPTGAVSAKVDNVLDGVF